MNKRLLSFLMVLAILFSCVCIASPNANAAWRLEYAPYAMIENNYSSEVKCGTVRYISQITSSDLFYSAYWPAGSFGGYGSPGTECGTASISMALSYIGVNKTPKEILEAHNGYTYFDGWGPTTSSPSVLSGMSNYVNGGGKYSPVIIHLPNYSSAGHWVVLVGTVSSGIYRVLDPANNSLWNITVNGASATYAKSGYTINDTIDRTYQYYNPNAVICSHTYAGEGVCSKCGYKFPWESTKTTSCAGIYKVTLSGGTYPRLSAPYSDAAKSSTLFPYGAQINVSYGVTNAYGNTWYYATYNGVSGFVNEDNVSLYSRPTQQFTCTISSPAEGAVVPKSAYPVIGTLTSQYYQIKEVKAYIDGSCYATVSNVNSTSLELRSTAINQNLDFASLLPGKHVLRIDARDSQSSSFVTVINRTFYTETVEEHTHQYSYKTTTAPTCTTDGVKTYTCSCGDSYTEVVPAYGHSWCSWEIKSYPTCTQPGSRERLCQWCYVRETESIPATGHSYNSVVCAPTCTEQGYTTHTCMNCGDSYVDSYTPASCPGAHFTDMPAVGHWAHASIDWAVANGITNGTSATKFSPNADCTRGQIVTFLWRAAGEPEPTATNNPFTDVDSDDFYYKAVLWAVEKGITTGASATKFNPKGACNRAQVVTFMWRAAGEPTPTSANNPFADVPADKYYHHAVLWAVENGITTGTSATKFAPNNTCTRGQIVTFLYRGYAK